MNKKDEITKKEKNVLALVYVGTTESNDLAIELGIPLKKIEILKKNIFIKLGVDNWQKAINRSFEKNILVKNDFFDDPISNKRNKKTNILLKINNDSNKAKIPVFIELILIFVLCFKRKTG
jgi:DNA-binding CsgD family transcriptional regulator